MTILLLFLACGSPPTTGPTIAEANDVAARWVGESGTVRGCVPSSFGGINCDVVTAAGCEVELYCFARDVGLICRRGSGKEAIVCPGSRP